MNEADNINSTLELQKAELLSLKRLYKDLRKERRALRAETKLLMKENKEYQVLANKFEAKNQALRTFLSKNCIKS
jgi:uncharacterized protein involved in exopolysaccharide biosynthesis